MVGSRFCSIVGNVDESIDKVVDVFTGTYISRPYSCCCFSALVFVLATVGFVFTFISGSMEFGEPDGIWRVFGAESSRWHTALRVSIDAAVETERKAEEEEEEEGEVRSIYAFYKADVGETANIFTPARLADICKFERAIFETDFILPDRSPTVVQIFYGSPSSEEPKKRSLVGYDWKCEALSQDHVDDTFNVMREDLVRQGTDSRYAFFMDKDVLKVGVNALSRSIFRIDSTLTDVSTASDVFFSVWDPPPSYGPLQSGLMGDEDRFKQLGSVRIRFWPDKCFDQEMDRLMGMDFMLAFGSVVVVFLIMWGHLGSLFLASTGMFQIAMSFPMAGLVYRHIFGINYFAFLNILVVYLVLGIGADDIFVLCDSWKHITNEAKQNRRLSHESSGEDWRFYLKTAYLRTAKSIFNTSFTTAVAFLSCTVSEILPMRATGWFTALVIIVNYIFTITFTPACLMIYHFRWEGRPCCISCPSRIRSYIDRLTGRSKTANSLDPTVSLTQKALMKGYLPLMRWQIGPVKPFPLFAVIVLLGASIQGVYFALQLTPPTKPEVWFPDNHMCTNQENLLSTAFYQAAYDKFTIMRFFWGISDMDTSEVDPYDPMAFLGTPIYDESFDLSTAESQKMVLATCSEMQRIACTLKGCKNDGSGFLMSTKSNKKAYSCFLEDFQDWLATERGIQQTLVGNSFLEELKIFRETANETRYSSNVLEANFREDIGFIQGQLRYVAVRMRSTMPKREPVFSGSEVRKVLKQFMEEMQKAYPSHAQSLKFDGRGIFAWYSLGEELVNGLFMGCAIAAPVCCLVLILSTWNFVIAFYAVLSVGSIVMCVLGFCKSAMDYDLGIGESITGVIVIGYSVDYVVHLAHMYCEAGNIYGLEKRSERVEFAIGNMGTTVFAGAITTAGAGLVMFFCFFTFFFKMALLICSTIVFSLLFAMFFFMGICSLAGPEKGCGRLPSCRKRAAEHPEDAHHDIPAPDVIPGANGKATDEEH